MPGLTRRTFLAVSTAGAAARAVPALRVAKERRILTLVYDRSLGMMRAVERVVRQGLRRLRRRGGKFSR